MSGGIRHLYALSLAIVGSAAMLAPAPVFGQGGCTVDTARFRNVGPAYLDNQTGLLWRHCAAGQDIKMGTNQCLGAMLTTEKAPEARKYVEGLNQRAPGLGYRMPTIDEVAMLAEARCNTQAFGRTPHAGYGGAPVWTSTPAGPGKVYQYDPAGRGKVAVDELDSPGVILLLIDPPKKSPDGKPR